MVEFPSYGRTCAGYLALPSSGAGPGVVVVQEWWGLVPQITRVCDRLAAEGFTALVPDLYHGSSASYTEPDEAGKLLMALRFSDAVRDLSGAVSWLLGDPRATGDAVGSLGFCMGGGLSLYLASIRPEVRACVIYYGVLPWPEAQPDVSAIRGAVLGHWAENDHAAGHEVVDALEKQLVEAGKDVEFFWYPGCDHAFFNEDRPEVYNPDAARLSWERTLAFFRRHLVV
jgi:carboxymethylenebutenolidase